jgi:signal transduction histidine kinase/DNA-binding response OmpR family regulator
MIKRTSTHTNDLAFLREESLQLVLVSVMIILYLWCIILFQPANLIGAAAYGPALLGFGLATAFILRQRHPTWASIGVILSIGLTIVYNMWRLDMTANSYLLAVVVSLTGLLFGMRAVIWVTGLSGSLVLAIGHFHWGYPPFSPELLYPVFVIITVGIFSSLAVRNLYLTLFWAWDRAMAAQDNEHKLLDRQGELARALKALDVAYTQLEYLNYDLARARAAADEARLAKQQLATNISHELRTPLNVIMAFSEMMYLSPNSYGNTPLPAQYRGDIREIYRSSKHLLKLTEDVLNLSKIEAGEMKISPAPAQLAEVVADVFRIMRPLMRDKKVKLRAELPDNLPSLMIDRNRVGQILLNLLNNARRFTEQGAITVQATLAQAHVQVTVADTGIGIASHELHKVFKEFQQLAGFTPSGQEGSGLGLAISKRFVEMHGGRIWAESEGIPGRGSQFHFTLPLQEKLAFEMTRPKTMPPVRIPSGRGRTILLLDQDPYIVQMLQEGLEEYQVLPVKDISDAPQLIRETHARAIVLNLAQQGQAWQQMLELRETLSQPWLPMILCSLVGPQQLGQALGVMDYLVKPITREALVSLLGRLNKPVRQILVIDDDPRMSHLLSRLLQTEADRYEITCAHNGRDGLRQMQSRSPDLVLMDLGMPEMDGPTLLAHIRADANLRHIPVVVITAHSCTLEEERRLGGRTLLISNQVGLTNGEAVTYLRSILNATVVPSGL